MATDALPDRRRWRATVGIVLLALLAANVLSNRVIPSWAYVPWSLASAALIVLLARRSVSLVEMGFTEWRRGLVWGGVLFALTVGVLALAVAIPVFHEMYHDRRVSGATGTWLYQAFVRIPFGTAVLEETAFRAVLPAVFALRWGVLRGCVAASLCFGVWHVLPAMTLAEANPVAGRVFGTGAAGTTVAVVFAVVGAALAGLWWCWIRYRARSVLATMIAHAATNSVAYTIAWIVAH